MKMNPIKTNAITKGALLLAAISTFSTSVYAQTQTRVTVRIENVAPDAATFQTPVWIGLHDGEQFDTYNGNTPAGSLPRAGSVNALGQSAMEAICEDGTTAQIAADFAFLQPSGQDTTVQGPNGGPLAPGEISEFTFTVDPNDPNTRYFSYASMVIPSNDFCISNGNPKAHQVFDESGNFVAQSFFVGGPEALDAGTEVNDELPENTAFFGQAAPNTGVVENGVIGTLGSDLPSTGFIASNANDSAVTILETPRFAESNFNLRGYSFLKVTFEAEEVPVITEELRFTSLLKGSNEVPKVRTRAFGLVQSDLTEQGTVLDVLAAIVRLPRGVEITAAHLHLGAEGENGPVVADLLSNGDIVNKTRRIRRLAASLSSDSLVGPLAGATLSDLVLAIQQGGVYVNIHTDRNPSGELRGQLTQGKSY